MKRVRGRGRRSVVCGSFHQGDNRFGDNSGKQCIPNAVSFLCRSVNQNLDLFTEVLLDQILINGDSLYSMIREHISEPYLLADDIPREITLNGVSFNLKIHESRNGLIEGSDSIKQILSWAFAVDTSVLFISDERCIALKCFKQVFYLFDSHSNSCIGKPEPEGCSCLIKFDSFELLCQHIQL